MMREEGVKERSNPSKLDRKKRMQIPERATGEKETQESARRTRKAIKNRTCSVRGQPEKKDACKPRMR